MDSEDEDENEEVMGEGLPNVGVPGLPRGIRRLPLTKVIRPGEGHGGGEIPRNWRLIPPIRSQWKGKKVHFALSKNAQGCVVSLSLSCICCRLKRSY